MDTRYEELIDKLQRSYNWHKSCWEDMAKQVNLSETEIAYIREEKAKMEILQTILVGEGRTV
jgi:ribosome recycling factor